MADKKRFLLIDLFFIILMALYIYYDHLPNKLKVNFLIVNLISSYGIILLPPIIYLKKLKIKKKNLFVFFITFQLFYFYGFIIFIFSEFKMEILTCTSLLFAFLAFFSTKHKALKIRLSILGHIFFIGIFFQGIFASIDNIFYSSIFTIIFIIIIFSFIKANTKNETEINDLLKFNEATYLYYLHGLIHVIIYDYIHVTIFQLFY
ncbi:hypothetical protein [Fusobacterium ulcerans]|uniref:hypothetical protein n=1 Tax=Fusobacterium ulcerans TaxID=861 RepID=UPI0026DD1F83|nr:hypothetical protein [Fusobacterium ulcerans]